MAEVSAWLTCGLRIFERQNALVFQLESELIAAEVAILTEILNQQFPLISHKIIQIDSAYYEKRLATSHPGAALIMPDVIAGRSAVPIETP